ncbi:MAG: four helix bundle protein [Clostridia bacterium]|nr:four helix bundle protein [Clostridia bacterium]
MKENLLLKHSEKLAVDIEVLCQSLNGISGISNIVFQIRKSSSSVFANVSEAQYPQSLPDMLAKLKIARKECMETESWLKLLLSANHITEQTYKKHRNLCGRIRKIITSSCITIETKLNKT